MEWADASPRVLSVSRQRRSGARAIGEPLDAERRRRSASSPRLAEVDWEDEVRLALEERASFSPDA